MLSGRDGLRYLVVETLILNARHFASLQPALLFHDAAADGIETAFGDSAMGVVDGPGQFNDLSILPTVLQPAS